MAGKIERSNSVSDSISLTASSSTSPKICFGPVAGGMVVVESVATATKINWYAAISPEGTAYPVYASGSQLSTDISASRAYAIPDELFGAPFVVAVTDAGTASIRLSVKG